MMWSCIYWLVSFNNINKNKDTYLQVIDKPESSGMDERPFHENSVNINNIASAMEKKRLLSLLDSDKISNYEKIKYIYSSFFFDKLNVYVIKCSNLTIGLFKDIEINDNIL